MAENKRWIKQRQEYALNPKKCKFCGSVIPYSKRVNSFCNKTCSASHNNRGVRRHGKSRYCKRCEKKLSGSRRKYCSSECRRKYEQQGKIKKWLNGELAGIGPNGMKVHAYVRRWLYEQRGEKCERCGWSKRNPYTNNIPLEIHHKDGMWEHHYPENLEILCPSCHSLTRGWRGANLGHGRDYLREYKRKKAQQNKVAL